MTTSTKNSNRKVPKQAPIAGWEVVWYVDGAEKRRAYDGPERQVYVEADKFREAREDEARAAGVEQDEYPRLVALKR